MLFFQTTGSRLADRKIAQFDKNITKRGTAPETIKKPTDYPTWVICLRCRCIM
jgi:hypothetical protein